MEKLFSHIGAILGVFIFSAVDRWGFYVYTIVKLLVVSFRDSVTVCLRCEYEIFNITSGDIYCWDMIGTDKIFNVICLLLILTYVVIEKYICCDSINP